MGESHPDPLKPLPPFDCPACGVGKVRSTNLRGRQFALGDAFVLRVDVDLIAPACDHCDELYLNHLGTAALAEVLARLRLAQDDARW